MKRYFSIPFLFLCLTFRRKIRLATFEMFPDSFHKLTSGYSAVPEEGHDSHDVSEPFLKEHVEQQYGRSAPQRTRWRTIASIAFHVALIVVYTIILRILVHHNKTTKEPMLIYCKLSTPINALISGILYNTLITYPFQLLLEAQCTTQLSLLIRVVYLAQQFSLASQRLTMTKLGMTS